MTYPNIYLKVKAITKDDLVFILSYLFMFFCGWEFIANSAKSFYLFIYLIILLIRNQLKEKMKHLNRGTWK